MKPAESRITEVPASPVSHDGFGGSLSAAVAEAISVRLKKALGE